MKSVRIWNKIRTLVAMASAFASLVSAIPAAAQTAGSPNAQSGTQGPNYIEGDCYAECYGVDPYTGHMKFHEFKKTDVFSHDAATAKDEGWAALQGTCPQPEMLMLRVLVSATQEAQDGSDRSSGNRNRQTTWTDGWGWQWETPDVDSQRSQTDKYSGNRNHQIFRLIQATEDSACHAGPPPPISFINGHVVGG